MQPQLFTIFSKQDLAAIQSSLDSVLSLWSEKWFAGTPSLSITSVTNAFEDKAQTSAGPETVEHASMRGSCKLNFSSKTQQQIYARATGDRIAKSVPESQLGTIEATLSKNILSDLLFSIAPNLAGSDSKRSLQTPAQPTFLADLSLKKGAGTVIVNIGDSSACSFRLFLSQSLAQHLTGKSRPKAATASLTPRKSVVGHGMLKIQITAGEAELQLSDLVDLKPGHVVRLNLKPDQTFIVEVKETRQKICDAYLGQQNGNKAIQLINQ